METQTAVLRVANCWPTPDAVRFCTCDNQMCGEDPTNWTEFTMLTIYHALRSEFAPMPHREALLYAEHLLDGSAVEHVWKSRLGLE